MAPNVPNDSQGNIKRGMTDMQREVYDNAVSTTALLPATPFAMSEFLTPQTWNALSVLIKAIQ